MARVSPNGWARAGWGRTGWLQETLRKAGTLRLFKLGIGADEFALVMREDFVRHVELWCGFGETAEERPSLQPVRLFLTEVLETHRSVSVSKVCRCRYYPRPAQPTLYSRLVSICV